MRLADRVALVTGGAGGIGAAIVRLFVEEGARVVVADRRGPEAKALCDEIGDRTRSMELDVTTEESWQGAVAALADLGGLDVLVNNAGFFSVGTIEELSLRDAHTCMDVNHFGALLGMRAVLPLLKASPAASIVNMSSGSGMAGFARQAAYASSKWALRGLTRCAAAELAADRIRVNSIHPGPVNTPMINGGVSGVDQGLLHAELPIPRWAEPEEIARAALFLACSDSSYITGTELVVDGGLLIGPRLPG